MLLLLLSPLGDSNAPHSYESNTVHLLKLSFTSKPHSVDLLYASCEPLCSRCTVAYCSQHIFASLYFSDRMMLIKKSLFKTSFTFDFYRPNSHFSFLQIAAGNAILCILPASRFILESQISCLLLSSAINI